MPHVFVKSSHDWPEHSPGVLAFAQALRGQGIDAELEQFHQGQIVDWPRWCNQQIGADESDFVLCVATAEQELEVVAPPQTSDRERTLIFANRHS